MARRFEVVEDKHRKADGEIQLPTRSDPRSAGYDFYVIEDVEIPPYGMVMLPTNVKAYMQDDEVLILANRSSNPGKKGLILANSIGVVDKDYYGNEDNDGHIMFAFYNFFDQDVEIKKGDTIGQAIFQKYYIADDDNAEGERVGGFGSTSK